MSYKLINPVIEGKLNTTFTAKSDLDAANKTWTSISKYISNNVPKFAFTLENTNDGTLSHFLVKEKLNGDKNASFNLSKLKIKSDSKKEKEFRSRIVKQAGGKHRKHNNDKRKDEDKDDEDDSSSTSSTSTSCSKSSNVKIFSPFSSMSPYSAISSFSPYYQYPIEYWWYDPYYYSLDSLFIPTFVYPLTPYVEITTLNYYP